MAITVTKTMLQYNYSWTATSGDDPKLRGEPDSNLFNRQEGYEVIYMLQKVANKKYLSKEAEVQRYETLIHDDLPSDVRSQLNVFNWLCQR